MSLGDGPKWGDERGQAAQVGAVLLLAVLVILLSFYQASVVPDENERIEFNDYQRATGDLADLRNAVVQTAAEDAAVGVTVRTGSQYPARALFVNPAPPNGRVRTTDARSVRLSDVVAVDSEPTNVRTFWDGREHTFSDRNVVFDPGYNVFRAVPVRIAQGYTYRSYETPVSVTPQTLVRGNRITLVTMAGDVNAGGYTTSMTVAPLSAHTRTVSVSGKGGDPFSITVPSTLPASVWRDRILADQYDPPGDGTDHSDRYVRGVSDAPGESVTISFEGAETYELRLGRVELRRSDDESSEPTPAARYLTHVGDSVIEDGEDGRAKLVVKTRDRFNNPRSNAPVTFDVPSGQLEDVEGNVLGTDTATVRTGDDGRAVVWYNASAGVYPVDAYLGESVDDSLAPEKKLQFTVVSSDHGGGDGTEGEGSTFILLNGTDTSQRAQGNITLTLYNSGSGSLNLTGVQLAHVTNIKGDPSDGPTEIVRLGLNGETRTVSTKENLRAEFFGSDPIQFTNGTNQLTLQFDVEYDQQVMLRFHLFFEGGVTAVFDLVVFG